MTIKQIRRTNEIELVMEGRLDTTTAPEADAIFMQAAAEAETLVLDFGGVQYVSSAGLRAIKRAYMAMRQKNGELYLKNVSSAVMEVLEMTGFSGILSFR